MLDAIGATTRLVDGVRLTAFDPEVVEAFRRVVAPYPVACEVTLADGRRGIVAKVPASTPDYPDVRVTHAAELGGVQAAEAA
jgi:HD-GYP domain-containing protein (c-di-GMP phosphodiesterase class II)